MKIAICDDTNKDLLSLEKMLSNYFLSKSIKTTIDKFSNPKTLLNKIFLDGDDSYDLYVLDIIMQQNGIEVAKKIIKLHPHAIIVFQTSSPDFAVDAFRVRAFDYILKPLNKRQVFECLDRISELIHNEKKTVIQVKSSDLSLITIDTKDIIYIESSDRRLFFHLINHPTVSTTTLRTKFLESIPFDYNEEKFILCHNSFLVNMNYIKAIKDNEFVMANNKTVPISKRMFKDSKDKYIKYLVGE